MTPDAATESQIEAYRRMTGEQRLAIALELHEMSCNIARAAGLGDFAMTEQELLGDCLRRLNHARMK